MNKATKKWIIVLLTAGLLGGVIPEGQLASAETVYTYKDETSSLSIVGSNIKIDGEHVVWRGNSGKLRGQIFYGNTRTGQTQAITTHGKMTDSPNVGINGKGEATVVWIDKRNDSDDAVNLNWDVYSYNVSTKKETKLNQNTGQNSTPSMDVNDVVWQTFPSYTMSLYNLATGTLTDLGLGRDPVVKNGRVIYKGGEDGDLYEYSIATGKHSKIVDLPYTEYVARFVYNGEEVLWMQSDLDGRGKYTYIDLSSSNPKPVDLTKPVKRGQYEYVEMSISNGTAVWLEASGDTPIMRAVDLKSGQTYSLGLTKPTGFIGFNGDKLAFVNNGKLVSREIIRTEKTDSPPASGGTQTDYTVIGPSGGVAAKGQAVRLEFDQGTFESDTRVTLEKISNIHSDQLPKGLSWTGVAWKWTADAKLMKPASLTFELEQSLNNADMANRAGIYRFDESSGRWVYCGGTVDALWKTVHTKVQEPGLYGIFLYSPSFKDINGHWAKKEVEVLASRWIVNGMENGAFEPGQPVTRAQFAKMLVQAAGLEVKSTDRHSFHDVPADHWAADWVEQAAAAGWIKGYEGGLFKPSAPITRAEMMVMLANAAGLQKDEQSDSLAGYKDAGLVRDWAKPSVQATIKSGLIKGNGDRLNPGATSTRAEAAMVIYRWLAMKGEVFND
ncbi:S-layer homology domain-containing protein [Paenibacillus sp. KQZ6P-2]|uniref:S-layer homology domain-containing protein n=1 Tax=Paenibacillus mangrovi TaxID=2931978 RepID=A0A9X2B4I9_9BACL|nr:S-layer homology domain-containing protein [Paenibacillus mangrovi]MCJ8014566.1 S-layer homology domain-containing protein [Paenibacillus mangrovi]